MTHHCGWIWLLEIEKAGAVWHQFRDGMWPDTAPAFLIINLEEIPG